jgi:hypothetical protein
MLPLFNLARRQTVSWTVSLHPFSQKAAAAGARGAFHKGAVGAVERSGCGVVLFEGNGSHIIHMVSDLVCLIEGRRRFQTCGREPNSLEFRRYTDFDFVIDYDKWLVRFSREVNGATIDNIKVSRGEENLFIWCFFLAIAQLALDGADAYKWVKYVYI